MDALDLDIEHRIRIDVQSTVFFEKRSSLYLALSLDFGEVFKKSRIFRKGSQPGYLAIVGNPSIADSLADFLGQGWVCIEQPSSLRDAVRLVIELVGIDQVELREH